MKIKTQFISSMVIFGVMLFVIAASVIVTNQQVKQLNEQEEIAKNIEHAISELSYLSNDYLFYHEHTQRVRWESKFSELSGDISNLNPNAPEQQALVNDIRSNQQRLRAVFTDVVSTLENTTQGPDQALFQTSWSRMAVQNQEMAFDAGRLVQTLRDQADQRQQTNIALIFALLGIFSAYFVINYIIVYRRALKSISDLQAGTRIIGSGNLDYSIETRRQDEIGELSFAFNQMAADLKGVTASKTDLEREITERKEAEARLIRSQKTFSEFFERAPFGVYVIDSQFRITQMNAGSQSGAFRNVRPVIGRDFAEAMHILWPEPVAAEIIAHFRHTLETGEPYYSPRFVNPRHDVATVESYEWELHRMTLPDGQYGVICYYYDSTKLREAEETLRQTSDYLENLFNYANAPIICWDVGFKITRFNHAFEKLTGRAAEEVRGKDLSILFPEETMAESLEKINHALTEKLEVVEIPILRKDGEVRIALWNSANVYAEDGKTLIATIAQGQDITERKKAEGALKRSNENLEQFAYVASHDLQEPLRTIVSYSQLLERRYRDRLDTDADEFIDYIVDAATRMQKLITDLLAYSRIGRKDVVFGGVDCNSLLEKVIRNLGPTIEESGAVITHDTLPTLVCNESSFIQLFQNLIANAIKFHRDEPPSIHIGTKKQGGEWVFSVSDNGIGIEERYKDRIFLIFQRLHGREKYPGTGIGLSICKKIVEDHGGRIWLESEPGKGSTFFFTVPVRRKEV